MFHQSVCLFIVVFVMLLSESCLAECPGGTMPNGFCWPTEGSAKLLGWHGENESYPGGVHLAQDIRANEGDDVYAIADGTVLHNSMSIGGYGGVGRNGGGLIIKHKLSSGEEFVALYAHLKNISAGTTVEKGNKIAEIGPYLGGTVHLHFGIRFPFNDDNNRWAGYGYGSDNGFTQPIAFIQNNAPYVDFSDSSKTVEATVRKVGDAAWYPPNVDCLDAQVWFRVTQTTCYSASRSCILIA
ncbi:MAG: hypothetical protein UR83_C0038G0014 [Candidatus Moranbacteria bacterium GW2011_GWF2_35_54]|nr:MAG: hypothetical protein UR83_C0038G0014 [Candidatus Moranbacteria bacterium GW2011_GWF2_35_54]